MVIRNTGARPGREVVQAYVEPLTPGARTPGAYPGRVRRRGRRARRDGRGQADLAGRAFARYDETAGAWAWPPGEFTVRIGRSSADLRLSVRVKS